MLTRISLSFIFFALSHIGSAHEITQPHIEVYGKSTMKVEPDTMIWNLKIATEDADLNIVSQKHSRTVREVLQIIQLQQVEKSSVQTSRMSFRENRVYRHKSWTKEGYIAKTSVIFKLKDFNNYEPLWFALSNVKGVSVNDISFDHSDRIGFRNTARKKALLAAKEKAQVMAETLGVRLGKPISISEIKYTYNSSSNSNMISSHTGAGAGDSSISLGTIPISMKVKLVMGIVTK